MKQWICNECNFPNFTDSVTEEEIQQELYAAYIVADLNFI